MVAPSTAPFMTCSSRLHRVSKLAATAYDSTGDHEARQAANSQDGPQRLPRPWLT